MAERPLRECIPHDSDAPSADAHSRAEQFGMGLIASSWSRFYPDSAVSGKQKSVQGLGFQQSSSDSKRRPRRTRESPPIESGGLNHSLGYW